MYNQKGQESAPFELLIAVIVMGFVIFAGMNAMEQLWLQKCYGTTDAKLEEMKTVLETVVGQKSRGTINFRLSGCFNENEEMIKIVDNDDPRQCAEFCGTPKQLCTLLEYANTGSNTFSIRKCLNIPPDTQFPSQAYAGQRCPNKSGAATEGYDLTDLDEKMPQGDYLFVNKTLATDTFPTICAYRKKV